MCQALPTLEYCKIPNLLGSGPKQEENTCLPPVASAEKGRPGPFPFLQHGPRAGRQGRLTGLLKGEAPNGPGLGVSLIHTRRLDH